MQWTLLAVRILPFLHHGCQWVNVSSGRPCSIVSCLQRTFEDTFIFYLVWGHGAFVTFMIYLRRV